MSRAIAFWVLMIIWLVLGVITAWPLERWQPVTGSLIQFLLFGLLGWQVFKAPLHD